ncbi:MAG: glycosyltransferase family 39 protein [Prevotellaceae bacterium]|jgi:hypothetical protein|nr:glycosyltransferase family 39 protein [Prevotellaceae bacterium]
MKQQKKKQNLSPFESANTFFENNRKTFLWIIMITGIVMSVLLFDTKASLSGDDCDYVFNADRFCHDFTFPGFRGPLYPIILSPFVLIFGVNLILLKSLSAVFILLSIWLLYKSFCDNVKAIILIPALLLVSVCSYVFFYASYTYSEPLFMLVQALFIYFFAKYFLRDEEKQYSLKHDWRKYLILGSFVLALGLTRSIGFMVLGVVILYFTINRRWKDMFFTLLASAVMFFAFQIFKGIAWSQAGSAYDIKFYLAKNFYNPNQGMEDLAGFAIRLIQNSNIYLSSFLYKFMGLRPENTQTLAPVLTILVYILFVVCLVAVFKKNKALLFTGLYAGIMNFASFIILQSNWEQDRFIMIYYPLMLLFLIGGIFYLFTTQKLRPFRFAYPLIIIIMLIGNLSHSGKKIKTSFPILQRNLGADRLAGLTPDWQNFILMSQWADKNIDKSIKIASRKPSISYIYTGRTFEGLFSVPSQPADSLPATAPQGKSILIVDVTKGYVPKLATFIDRVIVGSINLNGDIYNGAYLCIIDSAATEEIITELQSSGIKYSFDAVGFKNSCIETQSKISIHSPDELLRHIENRNIKYIILPRIRTNPQANTGQYINTLESYLNIISMKYPNRFFIIYETGTSEICELVEYAPDGQPTELNIHK